MSRFDTDTERVFKERVTVDVKDRKYVELGDDYIRFRADNGKLFEVKVREIKGK